MSAPRRIDECFDRLDAVASQIASIPEYKGYKSLAKETGFSPNYVRNLMSRLIRIRRIGVSVPRETLLRSLGDDQKFEQLIQQVSEKASVTITTLEKS